jgi:hypothetical protein
LTVLQQFVFVQLAIFAFFLADGFFPLSAKAANDDMISIAVMPKNIFFILQILKFKKIDACLIRLHWADAKIQIDSEK